MRRAVIGSVAAALLVGAVYLGAREGGTRRRFSRLAREYKEISENRPTDTKQRIENALRAWPPWIKRFLKGPGDTEGIEVAICKRAIERVQNLTFGRTNGCRICPIIYELSPQDRAKLDGFIKKWSDHKDRKKLKELDGFYSGFYFPAVRHSHRFIERTINHEIFHVLFSPFECNVTYDQTEYDGPTFEDIKKYLEDRFRRSGKAEKDLYRWVFREKTGVIAEPEEFERIMNSADPSIFKGAERAAYSRIVRKLGNGRGHITVKDIMKYGPTNGLRAKKWREVVYAAIYHREISGKKTRDLYLDEVFALLGSSYIEAVNGIKNNGLFQISERDGAFFGRFRFAGEQMFRFPNNSGIETLELPTIQLEAA